MTTVQCSIEQNTIFFECVEHSGDHDTCTICSTLCNVLVCAVQANGIEPEVYESGHVVIHVKPYRLSKVVFDQVKTVFMAVMNTFRALQESSPNVGVRD